MWGATRSIVDGDVGVDDDDDRETVVNDDGMDFDEIVEEEVRGGFDLEAMESGICLTS